MKKNSTVCAQPESALIFALPRFLHSGFVWLVSLFVAGIWWSIIPFLRDQHWWAVIWSVLFQEMFRVIFFLVLRYGRFRTGKHIIFYCSMQRSLDVWLALYNRVDPLHATGMPKASEHGHNKWPAIGAMQFLHRTKAIYVEGRGKAGHSSSIFRAKDCPFFNLWRVYLPALLIVHLTHPTGNPKTD